MQTFALVPFLAAAALAVPAPAAPAGPAARSCTPATYECSTNPTTKARGWAVCNTEGVWAVSLTRDIPQRSPPLVSRETAEEC